MEEKAANGSAAWKTLGQAQAKDSSWLSLAGVYTNATDSRSLTLYVESDGAGDEIHIDDARIALIARPALGAGIDEGIPSLKERFAGSFRLGAAVEASELAGIPSRLLTKHFDVLVAGNAMKPSSIQPLEGLFNWADADKIVAFAESKGMGLRFHTLQWHEQCPEWFFIDPEGRAMVEEADPARRAANKALLLKRLEEHIAAIGERYQGRIASWDVVNEVIDAAQPDGMRRSPWYLIAGEDYIETAFRAARAHCGEGARLYINDYNTHEPSKREALLAFVKRMLAKGVPIDGVGHQTHIRIGYPEIALIGDSIRAFGELGLDNEVTELDMSVYSDDSRAYEVVPERILRLQAERYKELFEEYRGLAPYISTVVLWGIADNNTWLDNRPVPRKDAPLLFGVDYAPKPAFWALAGE
jgi:endo-1,4-beta-xylanase